MGLLVFALAPTSLADVGPVPPTEDVMPATENVEPIPLAEDVNPVSEGANNAAEAAKAAEIADADAEFRKMADEKTRAYLNELSARRRVTTLFPNRQSMLHGVQENFVNTSTGNLTFLVRDLVRVGGMPIVFGRVYDSSLRDNDDFGPGWKLTVDERIVAQGQHLFYTDASNVTHKLDASGNDITPTVPAWTPIRAGQIRAGGNVIVLESNDRVRLRFKRMDDAYRLVAASHSQGTVRLTYRNGLLATISSEHGSVMLTRRADGRIVSARDDLGRTTAYEYDEADQLIATIDLGGEAWGYRYADAQGELAAITNPRGMKVLEASHESGRATNVRVLGRGTRFLYGGTTTQATDVLGRATIFHQSANGITEGVADPAGSFTQITFDDQYRPVRVTRDGGSATHLGYDGEGRLASIDRLDGETIQYAHNRSGPVAVSGGETARYRYSEGRVIHAEDASGVRTYEYNRNGVVKAMSMNGEGVQFSTNAMGLVTEIAKDGQRLMNYAHDARGRVVTVGFGHGERSAMATYKYNQRGFRETADYSYGVKSRIDYDAVGNLVHYAVDSPGGKTVSQDYEIGPYNEVLRIQNGGIDGPDVSFRYDEAGRVYDIQAGDRTANVAYDHLDRAKRVTLDGETLLEYDYGNLETDAAAKKDVLSGEVWTAAGTSGVFGTMDSIVYTRQRPLEFGPVAYDPALRTLYVETGHLVPDTVLLSSLARRMVPFAEEQVNGAPFGHDKPSNSLFIPPEYRAVNCYVCSGWARAPIIQVTKATTVDSARILITFQGACNMQDDGTGGHGDYWASSSSSGHHSYNNSWTHRIDFGDDSSATKSSTSNSVLFSHAYSSVKDYTLSYTLSCSLCGSPITLLSASKTFRVGHPCNQSGVDAFMKEELHGYLMRMDTAKTELYRTEPFERGVVVRCGANGVYASSRRASNPYRNERVPANYSESLRVYTPSNVIRRGINTCAIIYGSVSGALAIGHSHPYFSSIGQLNASYDPSRWWRLHPWSFGGCDSGTHGRHRNRHEGNISDLYLGRFSDVDKAFARLRRKPTYLLTPYGHIRLYTNKRPSGGGWEATKIFDPPRSSGSPPPQIVIPPTPTIPPIGPIFPSFSF